MPASSRSAPTPSRRLGAIALFVALPSLAFASGHGPVFGAATPTLGKGGWAVDQALMSRTLEDRANEWLLRTMISRGVTEDVQVSLSAPIPLGHGDHMPTGRMMASMSGHQDLEGMLGWRFHRQPVGLGGRFESTLYVGGTIPLTNEISGIATTPSVSMAGATGYVSRTHYLWLGGGYQRYVSGAGGRFGDVGYVSAVYGLRPSFLRFDYPRPDLRFFVEAVAERTGRAIQGTLPPLSPPAHGDDHGGPDGGPTAEGGGTVALVGPTALLLYKALAVSGGVMFPVHQRPNASTSRERLRMAINVSWFFFPK